MTPRGPLFLALVLRLGMLLAVFLADTRAGVLTPDSGSYLATAASLAKGEGFAQNSQAEFFRTPGYSLLLVPGVWLGHPVLWALGCQLVLGLLLVAGVFHLARAWGLSPRAATVAAWIAAAEPLLLIYGAKVLTETLFTTLLVWMLVVEAQGKRHRAVWLAAILPLVRPIALFLAPVMALRELFWPAKSTASIPRWRRVGLWLLPWLLVVGGWTCRNAAQGVPVFSTASTETQYLWHAAGAQARAEDRSPEDVRREFRAAVAHLAEPQRSRAMSQKSWVVLQEHPDSYCVDQAVGWMRTLLDPAATAWADLFGRPSVGLLARCATEGPLTVLWTMKAENLALFFGMILGAFPLGIIGLGVLIAAKKRQGRPLAWILLVYFLLLSGGGNAHGRFRHPLMPIIIILAAGAFYSSRLKSGDGVPRI